MLLPPPMTEMSAVYRPSSFWHKGYEDNSSKMQQSGAASLSGKPQAVLTSLMNSSTDLRTVCINIHSNVVCHLSFTYLFYLHYLLASPTQYTSIYKSSATEVTTTQLPAGKELTTSLSSVSQLSRRRNWLDIPQSYRTPWPVSGMHLPLLDSTRG
jgi:hypothetical protein